MANNDKLKSLKQERREFHDKVINFFNTEENIPYNYKQVSSKVGAKTPKQRALVVEILEQLLRGEKTAVGHCVAAYLATNQRMPKVGDYMMVMDYYGNPCCILHTLGVTIEPLPDIPAELRQAECPGLSGETWLARKQQEFQDLSRRFGFHYHPELPLLMETVEKVYPI